MTSELILAQWRQLSLVNLVTLRKKTRQRSSNITILIKYFFISRKASI